MNVDYQNQSKTNDALIITRRTIFEYLKLSQQTYDKLLECQQQMLNLKQSQKDDDYNYVLTLNKRVLFCLREYLIPKYGKMITKYNAFAELK